MAKPNYSFEKRRKEMEKKRKKEEKLARKQEKSQPGSGPAAPAAPQSDDKRTPPA